MSDIMVDLPNLLPRLTKSERARLDRLLMAGNRVWRPDPRNAPQCQAYKTEAFETLYGGRAGGGKSDLLLGLARNEHHRSLLMRRTFPDLERSLISRSREFFGDGSFYNATKHVWNINGRYIEFGHMERVGSATVPGDEAHYASAPYDYIAFDQLEQFPQYAYEFMLSRARSTRVVGQRQQRVRIVASANPVGENIEWIIQHWAPWLDETSPSPAATGELRWYKRLPDGREVETTADDPDAVSRTFIPAGLKDNPYLGEDYRRTLNLLPEPLRSALMNGDWKASITDDAYQVIPRAWIKAAQARWRPLTEPRRLICLGVDVARGGEDKTVIARKYAGDYIGELDKHPGVSTPDGQSVVTLIVNNLADNAAINIDVIGVGASAYDIAKERLTISGVNFANRSEAVDKSGKLNFVNVRAECYWRLREALDPGSGRGVALPPDPELQGDLTAPRWSMQTNGIKIESKDDIKQRLGRSPDCGDAVALAMYLGGAAQADAWIKALAADQSKPFDPLAGLEPGTWGSPTRMG